MAMQFSSLGSLDEKWLLQELGQSLASQRYLQSSASLSSPDPLVLPQQNAALTLDRLYLVWPTVRQVQGSIEGWAAGLSIPGSTKNVMKPFLKRLW